MYEQEFQGDVLYIMFYAVVAALNLVACFYLLFRRGNAFAPDITSPIRLRLWTGLFFAFLALSHVWYKPIAFLSSSDDIRLIYFVGGLLDSMTFVPLAIVVVRYAARPQAATMACCRDCSTTRCYHGIVCVQPK